MRQNLVLYYRRVVINMHFFYGHAWDVTQNQSAESIHKKRVDVDQVELYCLIAVADDDYSELFLEGSYVPGLGENVNLRRQILHKM